MRQDVLAAYLSNVRRRKRRRGDLFDPATKLFLDRVAADLPLTRQQSLDKLFRALKLTRVFDVCDYFYDFTAATAQEANLNLIADRYNLTVGGGAPVFVPYSHYVGNGTSDYLNTGFNPTTAVGAQFTQNSAFIGVTSLTDVSDGARDDLTGNNSGTFIARTAVTVVGQATWRVNMASSALANGTFPGHITARRTAATSSAIFSNGVQTGSSAIASAAPTNANMRVLDGGGSFSINQVRFAYAGGIILSGAPGLSSGIYAFHQALTDHALRRLAY